MIVTVEILRPTPSIYQADGNYIDPVVGRKRFHVFVDELHLPVPGKGSCKHDRTVRGEMKFGLTFHFSPFGIDKTEFHGALSLNPFLSAAPEGSEGSRVQEVFPEPPSSGSLSRSLRRSV